MYEAFFGLSEKPFSQTWRPEYLFLGESHREALSLFNQLNNDNCCFAITGEPGIGKTTLLRHICNTAGNDTTIGMVGRQHYTNGTLAQWINAVFKLPHSKTDQQELHGHLMQFLTKQNAQHKKTVLIIDDAQQLKEEHLVDLKNLLQQIKQDKLSLQLVLAGSVQLPEILQQSDIADGMGKPFRIEPLSQSDTQAYITHHLHTANGVDTLFDKDALDSVFEHTHGTPRSINLLCDSALVYGFVAESKQIGTELVNRVVEDRKSGHLFDTLKKAEEIAKQREATKPVPEPVQKTPATPSQPVEDKLVTAPAKPRETAKPTPAVSESQARPRQTEARQSSSQLKPILAAAIAVVVLVSFFTLSGDDEEHIANLTASATTTQQKELSFTEKARLEHEAAKRAMAEAKAQARKAAELRARLTRESQLAKEQAEAQAREAAALERRQQQEREAALAAARKAEEAARVEAEKKAHELELANARQQEEARQAAILAARKAEEQARKAADLRAQQEREAALAKAKAEEQARKAAERQAQQERERQAAILAAQKAEEQARKAAEQKAQQEHEAALARARAEEEERIAAEQAAQQERERQAAILAAQKAEEQARQAAALQKQQEQTTADKAPTQTTISREQPQPEPSDSETEVVRFTVPHLKGNEEPVAQASTQKTADDTTEEKTNFASNPCTGPAARFMSTCK